MCWTRKKKRQAELDSINDAITNSVTEIINSARYDDEASRIADALRAVIKVVQDDECLKLISKSGKPEEETKRILIFPFLRALGYDVFDERIVFGERKINSPDWENDKKVDYSIAPMNNEDLLPQDHSTIMLEAKVHTDELVGKKKDSPWDQLAGYFNNTEECKLAILANGKKYFFYGCDPESAVLGVQKLAAEPFLVVDLSTIDCDGDELMDVSRKLVPFTYSSFDMQQASDYIESVKPFMSERLRTVGFAPQIINAIRNAVGNTEMIDDATLTDWFAETITTQE